MQRLCALVALALCVSGQLDEVIDIDNTCDGNCSLALLQRRAVANTGTHRQALDGTQALGAQAGEEEKKQKAAGSPKDLQCWKNTGGTCSVWGCGSWRGEVTCGEHHWCMCKPGFCAAADGMCHPAQNEKIAERVVLRSVKYPNLTMKVDQDSSWLTMRRVWLEDTTTDQNRFNIWRLPQRKNSRHQNDFLLESVAYPGQLVYTKSVGCGDSSTGNNAIGVIVGAVTATAAHARGCPQQFLVSKAYEFYGGVDAHAFTIEQQDVGDSAIWMRSRLYQQQDKVVYVGRAWSVSIGDAGVGQTFGDEALWQPEPPLNVTLPVLDVAKWER